MHTEAINHDPAITFFQTGNQQAGRPCIGSWLSYGLGSLNENLPTFSVLLSRGSGRPNAQPLYSRLWGNAMVGGQRREREVSGFHDPRFRFSVNFYGAPALSLKDFATYRQDVILGASIQVSAPFEGAEINTIDGLRADFEDGWGLVRPSNTTPVLVVRFDAETEQALERIKALFRRQMLELNPDLELPF